MRCVFDSMLVSGFGTSLSLRLLVSVGLFDIFSVETNIAVLTRFYADLIQLLEYRMTDLLKFMSTGFWTQEVQQVKSSRWFVEK